MGDSQIDDKVLLVVRRSSASDIVAEAERRRAKNHVMRSREELIGQCALCRSPLNGEYEQIYIMTELKTGVPGIPGATICTQRHLICNNRRLRGGYISAAAAQWKLGHCGEYFDLSPDSLAADSARRSSRRHNDAKWLCPRVY